ncbi:Response regulator receiver domain-containing protein [Gordonia westfalica]|uniref:Response regulator receiver domain-containing protein n=1 Tax=Gordonia westfalica TaxID=158898 RepID=A0A1H2K099_9ACTN|nr:Response regulator receiver domain-containing protein [Gordonia westfalica]
MLIVEDEESLADPLAFLLRKEGFEASIVNDGAQALPTFERVSPDIVLLDLMLPGCRVRRSARRCAPGRMCR